MEDLKQLLRIAWKHKKKAAVAVFLWSAAVFYIGRDPRRDY